MVRLCLPVVSGAASRARADAVDDPFFVTAPTSEQTDAQQVLDAVAGVHQRGSPRGRGGR